MPADLAADLERLRASGALVDSLRHELAPDSAALRDAAEAVGHVGLAARLHALADESSDEVRELLQRLDALALDMLEVAGRLGDTDAALAGVRRAAR